MSITPFSTDADYIQTELAWLSARTARLHSSHELREAEQELDLRGTRLGRRHKPVAAEEARRQVEVHRAEEKLLRSEIDARLKATRKAGVVLGIDYLCDEHGLSEDERLALLTATVPCLGEGLTQRVLGKLDSYIVSSPSVEMLILLTEAESVEDRLAVRAMFASSEVRLVRCGLVTMDFFNKEASPADLPGAQFSLTASAFNKIVGGE